jgi:hypothetical protein
MLNANDTNLVNQVTSSFIFDNVNKILSTFIPANNRRQSNQVTFKDYYLFFYVQCSYLCLLVLNHTEQLLVRILNQFK